MLENFLNIITRRNKNPGSQPPESAPAAQPQLPVADQEQQRQKKEFSDQLVPLKEKLARANQEIDNPAFIADFTEPDIDLLIQGRAKILAAQPSDEAGTNDFDRLGRQVMGWLVRNLIVFFHIHEYGVSHEPKDFEQILTNYRLIGKLKELYSVKDFTTHEEIALHSRWLGLDPASAADREQIDEIYAGVARKTVSPQIFLYELLNEAAQPDRDLPAVVAMLSAAEIRAVGKEQIDQKQLDWENARRYSQARRAILATGTPQELWRVLNDLSEQDPPLVVFVTREDGDAEDAEFKQIETVDEISAFVGTAYTEQWAYELQDLLMKKFNTFCDNLAEAMPAERRDVELEGLHGVTGEATKDVERVVVDAMLGGEDPGDFDREVKNVYNDRLDPLNLLDQLLVKLYLYKSNGPASFYYAIHHKFLETQAKILKRLKAGDVNN